MAVENTFDKMAKMAWNGIDLSETIKTEPRKKKKMEPLHLAEIGTFFAGGKIEELGGEDNITGKSTLSNGSVYVRYMVPDIENKKTPVVFVHGGTVTGACYETTPDGGEGWDTLFVRAGHPVYIVDQVDRGRSSNGVTVDRLNRIQLGSEKELLPISVPSKEKIHVLVRGSAQFPKEAYDQFLCQLTGDFRSALGQLKGFEYGTDERNAPAIAEVLKQIGPAILVVHSQAGIFGWQAAALAPEYVKGLVEIEPQSATYGCEGAPETMPVLAVYGDNLTEYWESGMNAFKKLGETRPVEVLHLPEAGIRGNGHFLIMERNNAEIAEKIISWIDKIC